MTLYEVGENGVKLGDTIKLVKPFAHRFNLKDEKFTVKEIGWKEGVVWVDDPRIDGNILPCEYEIISQGDDFTGISWYHKMWLIPGICLMVMMYPFFVDDEHWPY